MKKLLTIVMLLSHYDAFASWNGCRLEVDTSLSTEREQFVLNSKRTILSETGLDSCFGNVYVNMVVAIHEGVHFVDGGLNSLADFTDIELKKRNSLFLTNMERLDIPDFTLPSPYSILEVEQSAWKNLFNDFSTRSFSYDYKEYIEDIDMLSSSDAFLGLGTEFNAYAHGSLSAWNLKEKTKEIELGLAGSIVTQRTGLLFFMGITAQYLNLIKTAYPDKWSELVLNELTSNFYGSLFNQAYNVLKKTSHCSTALIYEDDYIDFAQISVDKQLLKELSVNFSYEEMMKLISCQ